ncbi:hypothetical protein RFI_08577, partial [Reticulomyxa filosa]
PSKQIQLMKFQSFGNDSRKLLSPTSSVSSSVDCPASVFGFGSVKLKTEMGSLSPTPAPGIRRSFDSMDEDYKLSDENEDNEEKSTETKLVDDESNPSPSVTPVPTSKTNRTDSNDLNFDFFESHLNSGKFKKKMTNELFSIHNKSITSFHPYPCPHSQSHLHPHPYPYSSQQPSFDLDELCTPPPSASTSTSISIPVSTTSVTASATASNRCSASSAREKLPLHFNFNEKD